MRALFLALVCASCPFLASAQNSDAVTTSASACFALQNGGEAGLSLEEINARVARCSASHDGAPKTKGDVIMQRPGDGAGNIRACVSFVKNQFKRPRPSPPAPAKYSEAEARSICLPG